MFCKFSIMSFCFIQELWINFVFIKKLKLSNLSQIRAVTSLILLPFSEKIYYTCCISSLPLMNTLMSSSSDTQLFSPKRKFKKYKWIFSFFWRQFSDVEIYWNESCFRKWNSELYHLPGTRNMNIWTWYFTVNNF